MRPDVAWANRHTNEKRLEMSKRQGRNLLIFMVLLAGCAIPLLVHYNTSGAARIMENLSIMSSQETWLRQQQGEPNAWLMPTWNGRPRVNKPPMLVWMNLLGWLALPSNASVDQLIGAARLVASGLALLALASTYWITRLLANHRLARLAMLITGSSFLFIRQGRFATYDTHLLGWATLALAAGCTALTANASARQCRAGWLICGLAFGAALLTKGAVAVLFVTVPLLLFVIILKMRDRAAYAGLAGSALLGVLLFGSWYGYIFLRHPEGWAWLVREYQFPAQAAEKPFWYYGGFIALIFPWSVWLIPALMLPLQARHPAFKRIHWLPWLWFLLVAMILSVPHSKNQRYIAPLLPSAGIMLALFFGILEEHYHALTQHRMIRGLSVLHGCLAGAVCLILPMVFLLQPWFAVNGLHPIKGFPDLPGVPAWGIFLLTAALWTAFCYALHSFRRGDVIRSAGVTAAMLLLASSVVYCAYAVSDDNGFYPHRADAERVAAYRNDLPLYYYSTVPDEQRIDPFMLPKADRDPDKEFLIYYRGIIPPRTPEELRILAENRTPCRVCVRDIPDRADLLDSWGFHYCFSFEDGGGPVWKLYEFNP